MLKIPKCNKSFFLKKKKGRRKEGTSIQTEREIYSLGILLLKCKSKRDTKVYTMLGRPGPWSSKTLGTVHLNPYYSSIRTKELP